MNDDKKTIVLVEDEAEITLAEAERQKKEELRIQLLHTQHIEALGQLAAGVANDFKNLFSVIGTFSYMLHKKTDDDSPLRVYIHQIDKAVKKGADLINGMLSYCNECLNAKGNLPVDNKEGVIQCWEYMKCGHEKNKSCPVVLLNAGRMCWNVSSTLCGEKRQGESYSKFRLCSECEFFIKLNRGEL